MNRARALWDHFVDHWYEAFYFAGAIYLSHLLGYRVI